MSVAPEPTPQPMTPLPANFSAADFGGEIAQAAGGMADMAGEQILARHRMDIKNYADAENADGQVRIAQLRDQMAAKQQEVQKAAQGGGLDPRQYHDAMMGAFDQLSSGLSGAAASTVVQRQLQAQIGVMRAEASTQARDWQTVNLANQANAGARDVQMVTDQQVGMATSPDAVMQIMGQSADYYHSLSDLPIDARHTLTVQDVQRKATIFAQGAAERDGPQAVAWLNDGTFARLGLPGEQMHTVARTAEVDIRRRDAQAKAEQAAARQQVVVVAQAALRTINAGGSVPLPQLMAQEQQVRAMGPEHQALADELLGSSVKLNVNAQYGAQAPQAVTALAAQENAKIAAAQAAGKPVSLEQGAAAQALTDLASRLSTKAASDPWELAPQRGIAPTPFDWNDPHAAQALAARIPQAQVLARTLGPGYVMQPLQKPEAAQLKELLANGSTVDRLRVLSVVAQQEEHAPGATAAIFNQVQAPPEMRWAAALMTGSNPNGVQVASDLLTGYSALQKLPALVPQQKFERAVAPVLGGALGSDLAALAGNPRYVGVVASARAIYAASAAAQGHNQNEAISKAMVGDAVNRALGGYVDNTGRARGGMGNHNGAMVLPDGVSQQDFDTKQAQMLPNALASVGVQLPMHGQADTRKAPSLRAVQDATPINPGESQWDYQLRVGHIQWQKQVELDREKAGAPAKMVPVLPDGLQFRTVGDGKYKLWSGSGFLGDAKGRAAVWDYRTGKVSF